MSTANFSANNSSANNVIASDGFALSADEVHAIEEAMHHYEDPRAASIDALKIVQANHRWVPDGAIYAIADILGIPASDVEGVATFYSQIFRVPVGRHVIRVCDSMTCFIGGHENLLGSLKDKLGIAPGQTTADGRFTLLPVCCLGNCDKAPAVMIDDDTYGNLDAAGIAQLLESYA